MGESNSKSNTGNPFVDFVVDATVNTANTTYNVVTDPVGTLNPFSDNNVVNQKIDQFDDTVPFIGGGKNKFMNQRSFIDNVDPTEKIQSTIDSVGQQLMQIPKESIQQGTQAIGQTVQQGTGVIADTLPDMTLILIAGGIILAIVVLK